MQSFRSRAGLISCAALAVATSHAFFLKLRHVPDGPIMRQSRAFDVARLVSEPRAAAPESLPSPQRTRSAALTALSSSATSDFSMPEVLGVGSEVPAVKSQLLQLAAATERGTLATPEQKEDVEALVTRLQELTPSGAFSNADMDGKWLLVYSSVQTYRSSPFFASFQVLLGEENANRILRLLASVPYAKIGQVRQRIDGEMGELVSRVEMSVWPKRFFNGVIETRARIVNTDIGERLDVIVESTGIKDSTLGRVSRQLEEWRLPLDRVFERVFDKIPRVVLETDFLDRELRVTRLPDSGILIYVRDF